YCLHQWPHNKIPTSSKPPKNSNPTHQPGKNQTMPDKQTLASYSPSGKLPDRRPSTDTNTIPRHSQPASTSTSSIGSLPDSSDVFSSQPDGQAQSPASLKLITHMMLVDIPMLWGARLAATACGTRQTASSSQDESEDRKVPDIKTGEKTPDSSSVVYTAARGYRHHQQEEDGSDFYSGALEGDWYTRDRDQHWGGAVVDADMLYMRALVDGVHVNYV
ncbi:hypothetical protein V8F06_012731, partial [Rhypophila decipiens]